AAHRGDRAARATREARRRRGARAGAQARAQEEAGQATLSGGQLAHQLLHRLSRAGQLVGAQRDAADDRVAAAAVARAHRADVDAVARCGRPRVDPDGDLDAALRAGARHRVRAARKQQIAEEAGVARVRIVEPVEHDHVVVPYAEALHGVELARALGGDLREL